MPISAQEKGEAIKEVSPIVQVDSEGGEVLRKVAQAVPLEMIESPEIQEIVQQMSSALRTQKDGVALAAPQIGISLRIFIVRGYLLKGMRRTDEGAESVPDVAFVNPEFVSKSEEKKVMSEGCLSCRGYHVYTPRCVRSKVKAQNEHGQVFEVDSGVGEHAKENGELISEIFQHETDHLNGVLCIDNSIKLFKQIDGVWHSQEKDGSWTPVSQNN